jgi:protein gp37
VFVNSMSDVGHAHVPVEFVARIWAVMAVTPQHTYQLLTKRPGRLAALLSKEDFRLDLVHQAIDDLVTAHPGLSRNFDGSPSRGPLTWPLPNGWVGTSIESDKYVRRADALRAAHSRTSGPGFGVLPLFRRRSGRTAL